MIYPQSNGKSGENDGKITEIKPIGRGYNKSEHFRVVILFFCDHWISTHTIRDSTDTFYRAEQKLVDTMIVTDLVHLSTFIQEQVVLVSGDDDMWPGIRYALVNDIEITHFIPKSVRRKGNPYRNLSTQLYSLRRM